MEPRRRVPSRQQRSGDAQPLRKIRLTLISERGEVVGYEETGWTSLDSVALGQFRRRCLEARPAEDVGPGIVLAEIHPGLQEHDLPGGNPSEPETDLDTLRALAGVSYYPDNWHDTTVSRNYKAIVGRGDRVVVSWAGNRDFWGDGHRDRLFLEFGDQRTIQVIQQALPAAYALRSVRAAADAIDERVSALRQDSAIEDIASVHQEIRQVRRDLRHRVLNALAGDHIAGDESLQRLSGFHETLVAELVPERSLREVEAMLDDLQHDVEFLMARRSEEKLAAIVRGSEEEQRARFVQSVVILILAGAALFTGILTIPEIFPDSYPLAGLWAIFILMVAVIIGVAIHRLYQRPHPSAWFGRVGAWLAGGLAVAALAAVIAGLAEIIGPAVSFLTALTLSLISVLVLAWNQIPEDADGHG